MSSGAAAPSSHSSVAVSAATTASAGLGRAELNLVALFSAIEGAVFGWAALNLPWQAFTVFSLLALALALAKAATTLSALFQPRYAATVWRVSALLALAQLGWVTWTVFTGGAYVAGVYGSLGQGLFAALVAIWGLCVLLTLPTSVWALWRTQRAWPRLGARTVTIAAALVLAFVVRMSWLNHTGAGRSVTQAQDTAPLLAELEGIVRDVERNKRPSKDLAAPIKRPRSTTCEAPPREAGATLLVTYADNRSGAFKSRCFQQDDLAATALELREWVGEHKIGLPLRVDLIRRTCELEIGPDWVHTFELRPGLDGVCLGARCWSAWQLLIRDAFLENQPLSFIKDLRFGASQTQLREQLDRAGEDAGGEASAEADAKLLRIETQSWTLNAAGVHFERRMRSVGEAVAEGRRLPRAQLAQALVPSSERVAAAMSAAERHIIEAQLDDGRFRYTLHPFTGEKQTQNFNLARQAGTAFVLCELGSATPEVERTILRALELLQKHERQDPSGSVGGLTLRAKLHVAKLEDTALPLIAFLECRKRIGSRFDATIQRLTRLVLESQRPDGGLEPSFDLSRRKVKGGTQPLFGPGQASLALILLEQHMRKGSGLDFEAPETIRAARRKLQRFVVEQHWPKALYPFFFVEENWHCLAARAALDLERNPEYERFCLDYVAFKSRQILDVDSNVDPLFVGGMGFGNVVPPHNTGSAGFGEAMSAAISLRHARGEPIEEEQRLLSHVMGFLVRQQWTVNNCMGCVPEALGAISEHTHSPITRIDFVQHSWAALGHGQRMLQL